MKRVDLKRKLLEKREKNMVVAKYAHMWFDLVVKGNFDCTFFSDKNKVLSR